MQRAGFPDSKGRFKNPAVEACSDLPLSVDVTSALLRVKEARKSLILAFTIHCTDHCRHSVLVSDSGPIFTPSMRLLRQIMRLSELVVTER